MLYNFLVVAFRNLKRQLFYSFINITGLAIGLACTLVIFLYLYNEWSHDRHFRNADRIFRIGVSFFNLGKFANGPELLGDYLGKDFGGIEAFTRLQKRSDERIQIGDEVYKQLVYWTDTSFFKVFSYSFVSGNPETVLEKPHEAVLSEKMARKYFGRVDVVGRQIEVGKEKVPYTVSGIVGDDAHNSHLQSEIWLSLQLSDRQNAHWTSASVYNYVLLRPNTNEGDLRTALDKVIEKYVYPASGVAQSGISLEQYVKDDNSVRFSIIRLKDIYLGSSLNLELSPGGNKTNLLIFASIAVFILALAAVNFVNLATARATRRAKEIGIRKSLGTTRSKLVGQFLIESVLITVLSMILALGFAELFSFTFFWISGHELTIGVFTNPMAILGILLFAVIVGLVAGIYPSLYLTAFETARVLKGQVRAKGKPQLRNWLIVFQFAISISLIICTITVVQQLNFMAEKDLGFEEGNVLTIDQMARLGNGIESFRNEVLSHPDVFAASLHSGEPGSKAIMAFYTFQTPAMQEALTINTYLADDQYLDVMGLKLIAGRNFNHLLASDSSAVILNEAAVKALGLAVSVGAELNKKMRVIGVVSDFHWESLRKEIAPLAILLNNKHTHSHSSSQLAIKTKRSDMRDILDFTKRLWQQRVDEPMEYHFLDENFGLILERERVLGKAIGFFTGLAILISCLGLFGLSAFTTEQRTKEISIRKVIGASTTSIVVMLTRQFSILVLISIAIAVPASLVVAKIWLDSFAFRIQIGLWIFLIGAFAGLMISMATVAFHSIKASRTNPADTLKYE